MKMKPKSTTLNPRALLYRRYTDLEKTYQLDNYYITVDNNKWLFNAEEQVFVPLVLQDYTGLTATNVANGTYWSYQGKYFTYNALTSEWVETTQATSTKLKFNNVGKIQTNRYLYVCSFAYVKKGSEQGSTTQVIKGNIMPLETLEIQHFDDNVQLQVDDLVVIGNRLYSIEASTVDRKYQPKEYKIYSATLNSII